MSYESDPDGRTGNEGEVRRIVEQKRKKGGFKRVGE
jgi:hypothetical protein